MVWQKPMCGVVRCLVAALWIGVLALAPPAARAQEAPRGYQRILSDAPHAFRYTGPGEPARRGLRAERFELRDGDCSGADCGAPRYRAEIGERRPAARVGQDIWIGWSFFNGSIGPTLRDVSLRIVLGQWRMSGDVPPVFRLVQIGRDEGNWADCQPLFCFAPGDPVEDVVVQLPDMAQALNWGRAQNQGHICRLFSTVAARDHWMDIVVNTNFAEDDSGYLRIWVNDALKCDYRGRLVASRPGRWARPEHRRGIFASYTERWDEVQPDVPKPRLLAYFDEVRQGRSREEVDVRYRLRAGLKPVD